MNDKNLVTRSCPALILFVVDMSGSMAEKIFYEGRLIPKSDTISQIVNINISEIISKCIRGKEFCDYFNLAILGYNGDGVTSLLKKHCTTEKDYITVTDLMNADIEDFEYDFTMMVGGEITEFTRKAKKFINITPYHTTPMYAALKESYEIARKWCREKGAQSVPPIIINITDGEASDASADDLLLISSRIKNLSTNKGNSIFVNIHISTSEPEKQIVFPLEPTGLKDIKFGNLLYDMSSELSEEISCSMSRQANVPWCEGDKLRAVGYNTSISQLFNVLQIGSLSVTIES
ncbi:MAG: hypothetical protein RR550_00950 [Rikenellaceae bacterium]